eukprot:1430276-Rhodomonas_salina.1
MLGRCDSLVSRVGRLQQTRPIETLFAAAASTHIKPDNKGVPSPSVDTCSCNLLVAGRLGRLGHNTG